MKVNLMDTNIIRFGTNITQNIINRHFVWPVMVLKRPGFELVLDEIRTEGS